MIALLPFPAVLADRVAVMDAVKDQGQRAYNYGYLRSGPQYRVTMAPGDFEIIPMNPLAIYVPYCDRNVVFFRPRAGFFVGGAITFGPGFSSTRSCPGAGEGSASDGPRTRSSSTSGGGKERG